MPAKNQPIIIKIPGPRLYIIQCTFCKDEDGMVDEDERHAILKCSNCGAILARRNRYYEELLMAKKGKLNDR